MADEEQKLRRKISGLYNTQQTRTGFVGVHVQDSFKNISTLLNSIPTFLYQEDIEESEEFKRLKTNLSTDLEAYRLETYKLFDKKVHEHKDNAEKHMG